MDRAHRRAADRPAALRPAPLRATSVATPAAAPTGALPQTQPAPVAGFPSSDLGNAELFAHVHGDHVRFDYTRLHFDWHTWRRDADAEVHRLLQATIRGRLAEAQTLADDARRKLALWALTSESRGRLEAALAL